MAMSLRQGVAERSSLEASTPRRRVDLLANAGIETPSGRNALVNLNDQTRAAIIAFAQSVFPVLLIAGIIDLSEEEIGAVMLVIANGLTLAALLFPKGQAAA